MFISHTRRVVMFEGWINRMVTVVHSDCKKSFTGRVVSYSGESIILNDVFDTEGRPYRDTGQIAICIRNPIYEKFECIKK